MPVDLEIGFAPEALAEGSPEERAAFGLFKIQTRHGSMTEGWDYFLDGSRLGPLVSAYHVAEWMAWNWWRQRWEPRRSSAEWDLAHRMNNIGEGYVWPNVTIFSDGERTALLSAASINPEAKPFRYFGSIAAVVPSRTFETAVDEFVGNVLARLQAQGVGVTNLSSLWDDVLAERVDPEVARRRRLEAMLGREPDSVEDDQVERLIEDAAVLGEDAVREVAADAIPAGGNLRPLMTAEQFQTIAREQGIEGSLRDMVRLNEPLPGQRADFPAWKLGTLAAQRLRAQERLGSKKITNARLAAFAGAGAELLTRQANADRPVTFSLSNERQISRFVIRASGSAGRRFALARLIGDQLFHQGGRLHPATRSTTYRQKAQRAFAAELLSPFGEVEDMMLGDYSEERQEEVASHFSVSPKTIETLLKNHGRIERDDPEQYAEAWAA